MRRALRALALASFVFAAGAAHATPVAIKFANRIDAIGLVDYTRPPHFRVGDYVRYHVTNSAPGVDHVDYELTILVAGEEEFWGEKCFWIETWTDDAADGRKETAASLMSYDIFRDTLGTERIQMYRRKVMTGIDENGNPIEELTRGASNLASLRKPPGRGAGFRADTLGVDTVRTELGVLRAKHVTVFTGKEATTTQGDSTIVTQTKQVRDRWITPDVMLTSTAREETRNITGRRAWKVGYSTEAPPMVDKDVGTISALVIEQGHKLEPRMLPIERATSFEQQAASRRTKATRATAAARRR